MNVSFIVSEDTSAAKLRELLEVYREFFPVSAAPSFSPGMNPRNKTGRVRAFDATGKGPKEIELFERFGERMSLPQGTPAANREAQAIARILGREMTGGAQAPQGEAETAETFEGETGEFDSGEVDFFAD